MRWRGATYHRACLARLCCVFRLPRPLDAFFPPSPCRSCFVPAALVGFALQRVSLPIAGSPLGVPCPSWRFVSTIARQVMSPEHLYVREGPSSLRFPCRHATPNGPLSREREVVESCARTRPVSSGAFRGFSSYRKSVLRSAGVTPHDGSRSSPGISALQGSLPPRLDPADAESPLVRFVTACEQAVHRRFRVSIGGEVGLSLSRLPPLLGFLSSSWVPASTCCLRVGSRGRAR